MNTRRVRLRDLEEFPFVGKSCKIGNTRLAGTLKNQNPQVLKKLLFWLSCPCLHCFWWEKNNWPPYCTFYKSPMPYSENSNVPAWRIFSISCFHVASDLYFAQISCNRCNKDRIRICETIQWHCCLHIDSVPGIMSPRDKKFLILIWWLAMFLQWCQLLFLMDNSYCWIFFCHHLEIHLFTKFLGRRKVLLAANWRGPESIERRMSKWQGQGPFHFSINVTRNQYQKYHKSITNIGNILLASKIGILPILQEYPIGHICHAGTLYKNRFFIRLGCFQSYVFTVNHKYCLVCHIYSGW